MDADSNRTTLGENQKDNGATFGARFSNVSESLGDAEKYIGSRMDKKEILADLAFAVVAEELGRLTITKQKMIAGEITDVDKERLMSDWKVLARHYKGAKHQKILEAGVNQLRKLTPEETRHVIHEIRCAIEPTVNWAMEVKEVNLNLDIPILGKIGLGKFHLFLKGPRVAVRKFQGRVVRLVTEYSLWLAVVLGMVHWIAWTIFNESFLVQNFEGMAKILWLILLIPTTLLVWALWREGGPGFLSEANKLARFAIRLGVWFLVVAGWSFCVVWLFFGLPGDFPFLVPLAKLALPFFLVFGSLAAWLLARTSKPDSNDS